MRKLLLLSAIIVFALQGFTQNFPIDTLNSSWIERNEHGEGKDLTIEYFRYYVDGDTIIDDQKFFKIYEEEDGRNVKYMGAFREVEGKVYYKGEDYWGPNTDTIVLMYDFTAQIGDTIQTGPWNGHTIQDVDSVLVAGQLRKRLLTNWGNYWIEGIGSTAGFFYPISAIPITYWRVWISCYYIDDEMVYHNPEFQDCYTLVGAEDVDPEDRMLIAPNPVKQGEILKIQNVPQHAKVFVVDLNGRKLQIDNEQNDDHVFINTAGLLKGIYLIQVQTPDNRISGKLIVQ